MYDIIIHGVRVALFLEMWVIDGLQTEIYVTV